MICCETAAQHHTFVCCALFCTLMCTGGGRAGGGIGCAEVEVATRRTTKPSNAMSFFMCLLGINVELIASRRNVLACLKRDMVSVDDQPILESSVVM